MCNVLLPPGVNPTAVNKYIITKSCLRFTSNYLHVLISEDEVTEITARQTADFLRFRVLTPFNTMCYPYSERVCPSADSQAKPYGDECATYSTRNSEQIFMKPLPCLLVNAFVIQMLTEC
jgi:hypothetical protein